MLNCDRIEKNKRFLTDLYRKAPFERHAFVAYPELRPAWEAGDYASSDRPVKEFVPWAVENYRLWAKLSEAVEDDGVPVVHLSTGTHIYAICFGAEPHYYEDSNPFALPCVQNTDEADRIEQPSVWDCRPLVRIFEMADLVRRELGPSAVIGPPDMQTGFDTACILWDKTDLMCSMALNPDAVKRLTTKCANLFREFVIEFYKEFPEASLAHCPVTWVPPGMGPWVSNDECGAMSVEMFREFCLPELLELSATFGGLGMHCCANAAHQFAVFSEIPNFYAFNRVPTGVGWGNDTALDVLGGEDGPVFVPAWCGVDEVRTILEKAPVGTRFVFSGPRTNDVDETRRWLDAVRSF